MSCIWFKTFILKFEVLKINDTNIREQKDLVQLLNLEGVCKFLRFSTTV